MRNKIISKILIIFIFVLIVIAAFDVFSGGATVYADSDDDTPAYAYDDCSVTFDVDENKVLHVRENLRVGFLRYARSIVRRIPAKASSYKYSNGEAVKFGSFLAEIGNVKASFKRADEEAFVPAETDFHKNGTNYYLSVRNPEKSFDIWEKGYDNLEYDFQLEYDFDMSDDGAGHNTLAFNFFDEVEPLWFYHGEDKTNIARLEVTVNMPKPFDGGRAKVFYGDGNITENTGLTQNGNSLSFSVSLKNISENTVRIALEDNYFNTKVTFYSYYWGYVAVVGVIILICIVLTVIYRERKPVTPVEFEPPVVNPLHYSAYWHGYPQRKDVCTIILRWAQLGCIKIEKDGKRDLVLTKLKPLPDNRSGAEKQYFNELFRYGDEFRSKETRGFQNRKRKDGIRYKVNALVKESEKPTPFEPQTERVKTLIDVLSVIALAVVFVYFISVCRDWIFIAVIPFYLAVSAFPLIKLAPSFTEMQKLKQRDISAYRWSAFTSLFLLIPVGLMCWILFTTQYIPQYDYMHITVITLSWILISFFLLPKFIKKRTDEAQELYGRMLGFKRFIMLADMPRMELLLNDNPDYFYDVLPYCMVMGLSKKIDKQMQYLGVAVPDWAVGFNPAYFAEELFYSIKHAIIMRKKKDKRSV